MYTQIKHVYLSYAYKYIYRQLSTEGMHDRDVMAAGYVDIIPSREKATVLMHAADQITGHEDTRFPR
jgi:hypothetical protein